jgi:DNA-binding response OmpR family regulator
VQMYDGCEAAHGQMTLLGLQLFSGKLTIPGTSTGSSAPIDDTSRKQRVLVVDDEQLIAHSLRDILSRAGFDTVCALSGTEAIELAEQICPDIVISDVIMPDLDGVQTAIRIRRSCPDARILLFSGQAATSDVLERARAEGHDFELLPKPIHPNRLLAAIRKLT